jgi:hypothetical protein
MMMIVTAEVAMTKIDTAGVTVGVTTMTTKVDTIEEGIAGVMKKMTVGAITLTVGAINTKATGAIANRNHILTLTSPTICLNPPGVCLHPAVHLPVARAIHNKVLLLA